MQINISIVLALLFRIVHPPLLLRVKLVTPPGWKDEGDNNSVALPNMEAWVLGTWTATVPAYLAKEVLVKLLRLRTW